MKGSIFLLDDNYSDMFLASKVIENEGYNCTMFTDPHQALEWLLENKPVAIFLDLQMPYASGFDLIPQIRTVPNAENTPLIIMSGKKESHNVTKAIQLGANDYIFKPIDPLVLQEKVRKLNLKEDKEFPEVYLSEQNHKEAFIQKPIELISLSEFGITASTSYDVPVGDIMHLNGLVKEVPDLHNAVVRCLSSEQIERNKFKIQFTFVGLTESVRQKVRTFIRQIWIKTNRRVS
jgi:CheY-like chemotaxis protein